jgi:hypothetical protein
MSDFTTRLWERAEATIEAVMATDRTARGMAKAATVAVLKELSDEIEKAEEDDVMWPDSDDLAGLADELDEREVS